MGRREWRKGARRRGVAQTHDAKFMVTLRTMFVPGASHIGRRAWGARARGAAGGAGAGRRGRGERGERRGGEQGRPGIVLTTLLLCAGRHLKRLCIFLSYHHPSSTVARGRGARDVECGGVEHARRRGARRVEYPLQIIICCVEEVLRCMITY